MGDWKLGMLGCWGVGALGHWGIGNRLVLCLRLIKQIHVGISGSIICCCFFDPRLFVAPKKVSWELNYFRTAIHVYNVTYIGLNAEQHMNVKHHGRDARAKGN